MFYKIFCLFIFIKISHTLSPDCVELTNMEIKHLNWKYIENCLPSLLELENVDDNVVNYIWQQIKDANGGIENIPPETYNFMTNFLNRIPIEDIANITINELEIIEAFGKVVDFDEEKMKIIADKVRVEWTTKSPEKFSEYDLMSLGKIICYLNKSEISRIHGDAYKYAAEKIGLLNCSSETLTEFAKLALRKDAFGPPNKWSKFDVYLIGNVINGLNQNDLALIPEDILKISLRLNNTTKSSNNETESNITRNKIPKKNSNWTYFYLM